MNSYLIQFCFNYKTLTMTWKDIHLHQRRKQMTHSSYFLCLKHLISIPYLVDILEFFEADLTVLCICMSVCVWAIRVSTCVYLHPSFYPSVMNSQLMKEPLLLLFHSQKIITLCLKPFCICTTASFSCHRSKNPILSLLSLLLPFCYTFTPQLPVSHLL